jgi:hypothetical protein
VSIQSTLLPFFQRVQLILDSLLPFLLPLFLAAAAGQHHVLEPLNFTLDERYQILQFINMIKRGVTALEVNRTRRTKSYLATKSTDKDRAERRGMIKQILDGSDHKSNLFDSNSDDEDDYLARALSLSSHAEIPAKRGPPSPLIDARKDPRRTATPTLITRKKSILSKDGPRNTDSTASDVIGCVETENGQDTASIGSYPSIIRNRGGRGDLSSCDSQHSSSDHDSSHYRRGSSGTPLMRRRKSSRGDMPNDVLSTRQRSRDREEQAQGPPPPPPPSYDSSVEMSKSSRKGRRRSCRGDIVMDNIQYSVSVDDTSESLNSLSLVSGGSNPSEVASSRRGGRSIGIEDNSVPRQIVERRRSCRGDMAMDNYFSTDPHGTSSARSNRTADRVVSAPRRASSFGLANSKAKMSRRQTETHVSNEYETMADAPGRPRKSCSWGSTPSKPRRRLSLGLRKSFNESASQNRDENASMTSSSYQEGDLNDSSVSTKKSKADSTKKKQF